MKLPRKLKNFLDGNLFDYRRGYILTHPLLFYKQLRLRIKWANQRVFRGWDDRVLWSLDYYLAKHIPIWMEKFKVTKGIPMVMFGANDFLPDGTTMLFAEDKAKAKWFAILDTIKRGFESYLKLDEVSYDGKMYKILLQEYEDGFTLFRKYFSYFWD